MKKQLDFKEYTSQCGSIKQGVGGVGRAAALKMLLRAPAKSILTFLFLAAASFALFSRVIDYAVTTRETARVKNAYHGVAALDNSVPDMMWTEDGEEGISFGGFYKAEDKPWSKKGQIKRLLSLPGVALADIRYMTAGKIADYRRLPEEDSSGYEAGSFVLEGTFVGYEDDPSSEAYINLKLEHVVVHAGELTLDPGKPLKIKALVIEDLYEQENPFQRSFFDGLEKDSRCLITGEYNNLTKSGLEMGTDEKAFCVIDEAPEDYLETEAYAYYKGQVEAIKQSLCTYDIVYTSDMRAIPRLNERSMVISEGRPLAEGDVDACVVNARFLETYHLSIGDKIPIGLGDQLFHQNGWRGAQAVDAESISKFIDTVELEIVGAYRFTDDASMRLSEFLWSYSPSTVFVPSSLLPVKVPGDYETAMGEFSLFIADADKIEAFREAAEPVVAGMGVGLRLSDGGWAGLKGSFGAGALASFLTTLLYLAGVVLALVLAACLYIGRSKEMYAVMRTLGVPGRKARGFVVLPFVVLSALAIPVGGIAGLIFASDAVSKTLMGMAGSLPDEFAHALDATIPAYVILACLVLELLFIALLALFFLYRMKKVPPLELLQGGKARATTATTAGRGNREVETAPGKITLEKISAVSDIPLPKTYPALCHAASYIWRKICRGIGKTAVSLLLAATLAAGVGTFVVAKLAYQEAFYHMDVNGRALDFSSESIAELVESDLVDGLYCYNHFGVLVNGKELHTPLVTTNDLSRYLADDSAVTYAKGYDLSVFDGTGPVCLMGKRLADDLGIHLGDEITLLSDTLYSLLEGRYEERKDLLSAAQKESK